MARALPSLADSPAGIDTLVRIAVFSIDPEGRDRARQVLRATAAQRGIVPASIRGLYDAVAQSRIAGFTVPALHLRGPVYDAARAAFRAAAGLQASAALFAITRAEMEEGAVRPSEYAVCVLAAAARENWTGPVFLRSDLAGRESVDAGFYNLDLDASALVSAGRATAAERQRASGERTGEIAAFVRTLQPPGVEIAVTGRMGGSRVTVGEAEAFLDATRGRCGISTLGVATSDAGLLQDLGSACRARGVAGASLVAEPPFSEEIWRDLPRHDAVEVPVAAEIQRVVADHPALPPGLRKAASARAWALHKRDLWEMPAEALRTIGESLEAEFRRIFSLLGIKGTRKVVDRYVASVPTLTPQSAGT